ncbi:hypothetical protein SUDANB58_02340 [Streptomyces sp. enrichment culture]
MTPAVTAAGTPAAVTRAGRGAIAAGATDKPARRTPVAGGGTPTRLMPHAGWTASGPRRPGPRRPGVRQSTESMKATIRRLISCAWSIWGPWPVPSTISARAPGTRRGTRSACLRGCTRRLRLPSTR